MVKKPPSKKAFGVFYPFSLLNTFNAPWKLDYLARKFYDSSYTINKKKILITEILFILDKIMTFSYF